MECYICQKDDWKKLNLHSQIQMQVCKGCGNLCHEVDPSQESKILEFYRKDYRGKGITHTNIVTTTNKLQYIMTFLEEFLKDKKGLLVADIGAATGYFLNAMKRIGHKVTGSEYTISMRRMSEHFYGIPLTEELNTKYKYDLINIYHVLEHMMLPDKKLKTFKDLLTENGAMHISTPYWLENLEDQDGTGLFNAERTTPQQAFDHLFHKNHINIFTKNQLKNLFRKTGLTILKENDSFCGQTYLVHPGQVMDIEPEDWQEVERAVLRQKTALQYFGTREFQKAVKEWPNYPEAHLVLIFKIYAKDPSRQEDMIKALPEVVKLNGRVLMEIGKWMMQREMFKDAEIVLKKAIEVKPGVQALAMLGDIYTRTGRHREAMALYGKVAELHPYQWAVCMNWIIWNATQMPTWDERGMAEAKEVLFKQALEQGIVKKADPEPVDAQPAA